MSEQTDPEALCIFDALIRHAKAEALREAADDIACIDSADAIAWLRYRADDIEEQTNE